MKKHLLSLLVLVGFIFLAVASTTSKIHYTAFNNEKQVEEKSIEGNYILMEDGSRIHGKKVTWKSGILAKDQVKIDDEKFPMRDVKGYMTNNIFYIKKGNEFIKRIVHGKINIYVQYTQVSRSSTDRNGFTHNHSYTRTDHYSQAGDNGQLIGIGGQEDIVRLVSDCPIAVEMADISNSKLRKAIKKDLNYMNRIFEIYNNDCKPE